MVNSKYIAGVLAWFLNTVVVAAGSNRDWEDILNSFEDYKNELINEKSKAIVKIFGEQTEKIDLNSYVGLDNYINDVGDTFSNSFFCFGSGAGNEKNKKKKNDKKSKAPVARPGEKKVELSARGLIISNDGYILATYSSIQCCEKLYVEIDSKKYNVVDVCFDEYYDVALLKIKASNLPYVFIDFPKVKNNGKYVYPLVSNIPCHCSTTISSVGGNDKSGSKKTKGKASNENDFNENFSFEKTFSNTLCDTSFLINSKGNLVGMVVGKGKGVKNCIGKFCKVLGAGDINDVVEKLKSKKEYIHDFCGLGVVGNNEKIAKTRKLKVITGCVIVSVDPSRNEGFRTGDLIVALNNCKVENIIDLHSIFDTNRNDNMVFTVTRNNKNEDITVPFGKMSPVLFDFSNNVLTTKNYTFKNPTALQKGTLDKKNISAGIIVYPNIQGLVLQKDFVLTKIDHLDVVNVDFIKRYLRNLMQQHKNTEVKDLSLLVEGYYLSDLSQKKCFAINLF